MIESKIKPVLKRKFPALYYILMDPSFVDFWQKFEELVKKNFEFILAWSLKIRSATRRKLQELDQNLKEAKILTSHIVISSVYRLRYELREMNEMGLGTAEYFADADQRLFRRFWRESVINFGKSYEGGDFNSGRQLLTNVVSYDLFGVSCGLSR